MHGQVLAEAIRLGVMAELEALTLSWNSAPWHREIVAILDALEAGENKLKELSLRGNDMSSVVSSALCCALASEPFKHIQKVDVSFNPALGDDALADLVKALTPHRELTSFIAAETGMSVEAGQALIQALLEEAWPKLKELDVNGNDGLDGAVWEGMADALEGGAMQRVEILLLYRKAVSTKSAERLCKAFVDGACPRLRRLWVSLDTHCWEGLFEARPDVSLG